MVHPADIRNTELAAEADEQVVKHHDEIDALAEKYYPEEWKNHPDYIRKQDQKALRGIQG